MRLTINDLQRQGLSYVSGATGDDIIASTTTGGIRIMKVTLDHTGAAGIATLTDAATAGAVDLRVRCLADTSAIVDFAPYGWRVSNVSTVTTGTCGIFYFLDE